MKNRVLKMWRVRFHMNRFEPFPYRDETVDAYDKAQAITVAVMHTMHEPWAKHVKKTTASRARNASGQALRPVSYAGVDE